VVVSGHPPVREMVLEHTALKRPGNGSVPRGVEAGVPPV
jgi:hypothetical protein